MSVSFFFQKECIINRLWRLIGNLDRAAVLLELSDVVRISLLEQTSEQDIYAALSHIESADLSELLSGLPKSIGSALMAKLDQSKRQRIQESLSFPNNTTIRSNTRT